MSGNKYKKRILFLNHWARYLGGAEFSLLDILPEIVRNAEVHLVTSESGPLSDRLQNTGVIHVVIPCVPNVVQVKRTWLLLSLIGEWRSLAAFLMYTFGVRRYVKRVSPECIHANVPKSHMTLFLLMLLGFRGKGVVHMREIFPKRSLSYQLYRFLFPSSRTTVIAISHAVKKALPYRMRKRAAVIYNGVTIFSRSPAPALTLPVRFLYLGRVVPWKGCHFLIDAFSRLTTKFAPGSATFCLTGATTYWDPSYRGTLVNLIENYNLKGLVTLSEMTDDPYGVLCRHDVLCMASTCEPFGRVAVEAQGCALPVIGFSSGGLPEIVVHGETGLLVNDGDIDGLATAMASLISDPHKIIAFGRNGRDRAQHFFNRDLQVPLIVDHIMRTVDNK